MTTGVVTFAGTAAAADTATITANPNTTAVTSTHTATALPEDEDRGQGLESIQIDYNSAEEPSNVEKVGKDDVKRIGIDNNEDGEIDINLSDSFTEIKYDNNFGTITFYFDGSHEIKEDEEVLVEYGDVVNPNEPGDYQTQIAVNVESTDHPSQVDLHIEEDTPGTHVGVVDVDPAEVKPGENVSNQTFEFEIHNLSADGKNDTFRVRLDDRLGDQFEPESATVISGPDGVNVSDITLENDPDDDSSKNDTMMVELNYNNSTQETYDVVLQIEADVAYPSDSAGTTYSIDTEIVDSDTGETDEQEVETILVNDPPTITNFNVTKAEGTNLDITFNSDVTLSKLDIVITGDVYEELDESNFDEDDDVEDLYNYSATFDTDTLGNFTVKMEYAQDNSGNELTDGPSDSAYIPCDDSDTDDPCPDVSNFTLTNTSGSTLEASFDSTENLTEIVVDVTGDADVTLNETDFTNSSGTYTASFDPGAVGNYTATLETAKDVDGNDGASGQSASVTHTVSDGDDSDDSADDSDGDDSGTDSDSDGDDSDSDTDDSPGGYFGDDDDSDDAGTDDDDSDTDSDDADTDGNESDVDGNETDVDDDVDVDGPEADVSDSTGSTPIAIQPDEEDDPDIELDGDADDVDEDDDVDDEADVDEDTDADEAADETEETEMNTETEATEETTETTAEGETPGFGAVVALVALLAAALLARRRR
ncbi:PGF-CTERM sorting domain-containing protein [Haloparvum sp. PAK95]|uniref:PGF-CTERM sorting domain-containing protein n=1 Tax=Haloparvum sp. PAK95 TaxID=3418962 RepID=UPI003D2F1E8F